MQLYLNGLLAVKRSIKKHKDDIASLEILLRCDDCELIKKIGNWQIELTPNNNFIEENNYPDWYGFKKIDSLQRSKNFIPKKIHTHIMFIES